jgi:hypothetical protein
MRRRLICLVGLLVCCAGGAARAQEHYALELLTPTATGSAGTGHDANHRAYRAYTGIPYSFRAAATGGTWTEYVYSISGQPSGMTIVAGPCTTTDSTSQNGLIEWDNPTAGTHSNIQVCIDDDDEQDCETFTLTVGTSGFAFIDADDGNDSTGSGTLASPWQTINKAMTSAGANAIVYFRGATAKYNIAGITSVDCGNGSSGTRIEIAESTSEPVIWLGYPDETATIDMTGGGVSLRCINIGGNNVYLENLTVENCASICFRVGQTGNFGAHFRNMRFTGRGPGCDGCNSAAIMFSRLDPGGYGYGAVIQEVTDTDVEYGSANSTVKTYTLVKPVFEQVKVSDYHTRTAEAEAPFALKDGAAQFTIRDSACLDTTDNWPVQVPCINGSMHSTTTSGQDTYGEVYYNRALLPDGVAAVYNLDSEVTGTLHSYRNTYLGTITLWNVDSADGPFLFTRDVIVNSNSAASPFNGFNWSNSGAGAGSWSGTPDTSRVTITSALVCAPADTCTDADGLLVGSYLTSHGPNSATPKGHMLGLGTRYSPRLRRVALAAPDTSGREAKPEHEERERRRPRHLRGESVAHGPRQRPAPRVADVGTVDAIPLLIVGVAQPDGPSVPVHEWTGRPLVKRERRGVAGVDFPAPAELCGHHGHFGSAVLPTTTEVSRQAPAGDSTELKLCDPVGRATAPHEQPVQCRVPVEALPVGVDSVVARRHDVGRVL